MGRRYEGRATGIGGFYTVRDLDRDIEISGRRYESKLGDEARSREWRRPRSYYDEEPVRPSGSTSGKNDREYYAEIARREAEERRYLSEEDEQRKIKRDERVKKFKGLLRRLNPMNFLRK